MKPLLLLVLLSAALTTNANGQEGETPSGNTLDELIQQLQNDDVQVRMRAAGALGNLGPRAKQAIPALANVLQDSNEDHNVHSRAVQALTGMGPEALPALIKALQDGKTIVRRFAAGALVGMGPEAVPALIAALEDEDRNVRVISVQSLGRIGPQAKDAVEPLRRTIQDEHYSVATSATRALWLISGGATAADKTRIFPHGEVHGGLAAFLRCPGNRFHIGEPIPLHYGVILVGRGLDERDAETGKLRTKVLRPYTPVDPNNGSWFEVTDPDGNNVAYRGPFVSWALPRSTDENTVVLRHGEFIGAVHRDLTEFGTFRLSRPGTYKVVWWHEPFHVAGLWSGKLMSNKVEFEIVARLPDGGAERPEVAEKPES